ncbi:MULTISPECIES: hypothetical protein [Lysinibacillus]|uniref:hypothetical protein n=1 Tax=Lysinibacillus TaxID=400634 RepID=UPI000566DCA3|nr:hypothetical protein [Lysinibacillus sphaericus]
MRRDQISYFIYPCAYFIVRTINQWRKQESITWGENVMTMIGLMFFIYLLILMWNWSNKPYQWEKKDKET